MWHLALNMKLFWIINDMLDIIIKNITGIIKKTKIKTVYIFHSNAAYSDIIWTNFSNLI